MTKKRIGVMGAVMAAGILAVLTALAVPFDYLPIDPLLTTAFQSSAPGWTEPLLLGATWLGNTPQILIVAAMTSAVLLYTKREYVLAPALVALAGVLVPLAKEAVARPRPTSDLVEVYMAVGGKSFPSGHALLSTLVFGAVFYLAGHISGGIRWLTIAIRIAAGAAIVAIGASRVYLGVHWTSDVIGGQLMGALALIAVLFAFERYVLARRPATKSEDRVPA